jgi:DNA-binding PadR family transcriptional regulator
MSSIDLMILGLTQHRPQSPYEIIQFMETQAVKKWIKISDPAIYRNMREMAKKGYLVGNKVKIGSMPEKTVYHITKKGKDRFFELMDQISSRPKNINFDYGAFIAHLDSLDQATGLKMLKNLKKRFHRERERLNPYLADLKNYPLGGRANITHFQVVFDALIQWIDVIIYEFQKEKIS